MKAFYKKGSHVGFLFEAHELQQGLQVAKALSQFFGATFLLNLAQEIEKDLQPKLEYKNYYHICSKCFRELDERDNDVISINGVWKHYTCKPLKPDSERDR